MPNQICELCSGEHDTMECELSRNDFRVVVFGSARIKKGDEVYGMIYDLGEKVAEIEADIVTGGGPGLMEAANAGHTDSDLEDGEHNNHSIGIRVELPFEKGYNKHLDIVEEHAKFSTRLDAFMALSNVVVIAPGGIGTLLELFYTWQLMQVGHICKLPIILLGDMWEGLIDWVKENQIEKGLVSPEDLDFIYIVHTVDEAMEIIKKTKESFEEGDFDSCMHKALKFKFLK